MDPAVVKRPQAAEEREGKPSAREGREEDEEGGEGGAPDVE